MMKEIKEEEPVYSVESIKKQGIRFCQEVQEKLALPEDYLAFLELFNCYSSGNIAKEQLENVVVRLIGDHPDLLGKFKLFLNRCGNFHQIEQDKAERRFRKRKRDDSVKRAAHAKDKNKNKNKNNSSSYRVPPATGRRTKHELELPNPETRRRNNYEPNRNRKRPRDDHWEDEKYEIDVLPSWFESACANGVKLMGCGTFPDTMQGHRGIHFKRCVDRLHGDHSSEVLDALKENTKAALPAVLARLTRKEQELIKFSGELDMLL